MKFQHIHPTNLELFVLTPSDLDMELAELITRHLDECAHCADVRNEIVLFHRLLNDELTFSHLDKEDFPHVAPSIPHHDQNAIYPIQLSPRFSKRTISQPPPGILALAAQDSSSRPRFTSIETLASSDQHSLLRIVRDNVQGKVLGQVVSDLPACYDHSIITFDEIPGCFIPNRHGEISIELPKSVKTENLRGFLHLPVARFDIGEEASCDPPTQESRLTVSMGEYVLAMEFSVDGLRIRDLSSVSERARFLMLVAGDSQIIHLLLDGVCTCAMEEIPKSFELLLYR